MQPHLIIRVHADLRLGLGHVARALAIEAAWRALGGRATLAISGDDRARRIGSGSHPFTDAPLPCEALDLGTASTAPLPKELLAKSKVVLLDLWDLDQAQLEALRPLKIAVMEDDGDAHESADLLFQPFLEGVDFPDHPMKLLDGRKVRPYEGQHGNCRVLRGTRFAVVDGNALALRPKRQPMQPLAVHRLLVTFGGSDGAGLAQRSFSVLERLVQEDRWRGTCTILAPAKIQAKPFAGCSIQKSLPNLTQLLPGYDALWCSAGVTLTEALCLGIPAAAWGQNERQHRILADLAQASACFDLGVGPEAGLDITTKALEQWLGPEGQDSRNEQSRDGRSLVDGLGASRIAQELWNLGSGL
jgi:spore coat polysaccharide biosynthesis predicted glycosyltransferase SpsG